MGVDTSMAGRVYPPGPAYLVGREKLVEFATAVGAADPVHHDPAAARARGYADVVAPPTFAVVLAQRSERQYIADPAAGIDYSRVVHGEEKFVHHRPIVAGDELVTTLHVDSIRQAGGHSMITTRVEITDGDGAAVTSVSSTIVVRGEG